MILACEFLYKLHKTDKADLSWDAHPSSCSTYKLSVSKKGAVCLKARQYFDGYTIGRGHKYSPLDIIVWDEHGKTIVKSEHLHPGGRAVNIFANEFEVLDKGHYYIRVDASWALANPESKLISLTMYAD
jgi:hypothetical protein